MFSDVIVNSKVQDATDYETSLVKTSDGGKTWTELLHDKSNFYFNDVCCLNEKTCKFQVSNFWHLQPGGSCIDVNCLHTYKNNIMIYAVWFLTKLFRNLLQVDVYKEWENNMKDSNRRL